MFKNLAIMNSFRAMTISWDKSIFSLALYGHKITEISLCVGHPSLCHTADKIIEICYQSLITTVYEVKIT